MARRFRWRSWSALPRTKPRASSTVCSSAPTRSTSPSAPMTGPRFVEDLGARDRGAPGRRFTLRIGFSVAAENFEIDPQSLGLRGNRSRLIALVAERRRTQRAGVVCSRESRPLAASVKLTWVSRPVRPRSSGFDRGRLPLANDSRLVPPAASDRSTLRTRPGSLWLRAIALGLPPDRQIQHLIVRHADRDARTPKDALRTGARLAPRRRAQSAARRAGRLGAQRCPGLRSRHRRAPEAQGVDW